MQEWRYSSKQRSYAHGDAGRVASAFGEWIEGLGDWQWFVTRTFRDKTSAGFSRIGVGTAKSSLRDLLIRTEATKYAGVIEWQEDRHVPHLHVLLAGCRGIDGRRAQESDYIKFGLARWKGYQREGGAAAYLGKYLTKDPVELFVGLDGPYFEETLKSPDMGGTRL